MLDKAEQLTLSLPAAPSVQLETIARQRDITAAMQLSARVADLEWKELYLPLKIDKGHWSKIMTGKNFYPVNKLDDFMALTGNDIPIQYFALRHGLPVEALAEIAKRHGMGLHLLESETARQLRMKDEENAELRRENQILRSVIQGPRG